MKLEKQKVRLFRVLQGYVEDFDFSLSFIIVIEIKVLSKIVMWLD